MWVTFLANLAEIFIKMIKNPTVIVGLIGLIISGTLYIKGVSKDNTINKLQTIITQKDKDLHISQGNVTSCNSANDKLQLSQKNLNVTVKALQQQVRAEQESVKKWKSICEGRPTDVTQTPSKPYQDKGVVVDEKSNQKYINYINNLFNSK